jgi:protein associated with RNAse G/E
MTTEKTRVTINSRKFDRQIHRSWNARLIEQNRTSLIFCGKFDKEVKHPHLGVIRRGTISYEYYWFDRWYSVFRFHEPAGSLRNFYCNINQPPTLENNVLDYVDLDIDVIVWKDGRVETLDVEEFEINTGKYQYSEEIVNKTLASLAELLDVIDKHQFPFNIKI